MIDHNELEEGMYLVECGSMNNMPPFNAVAFVKGKKPFLRVTLVVDGVDITQHHAPEKLKYLQKIG